MSIVMLFNSGIISDEIDLNRATNTSKSRVAMPAMLRYCKREHRSCVGDYLSGHIVHVLAAQHS